MLVTPGYVAAVTGADISDDARVALLIDEASALVMEHLSREYTAETAPVAVRQAVAILVAGALGGDSESDGVKAEQIGDYRVEFAGGRFTSGLDIRRVEYLLAPLRLAGSARSVRTDVALDGLDDPTAGMLVVNR